MVIVIGSGISGLTAAALLAKRGVEVLLLEKNGQPGGSCSSFRRNGFTLDVGTAMLYGFGSDGFCPHRFVFNELEEPIDLYAHEAMNRLHYRGKSLTFWRDRDRFLDALDGFLPGSSADLRRYYAFAETLYENVIAKDPVFVSPSEMTFAELTGQFRAHPAQQLYMLSLLFTNAEKPLRRFVRNRETLAFFSKLTSVYTNTELAETPAILAATMFIDNHHGGTYYPAGGAIQLTGRLEKALEKYGGKIRYGAEVVAIDVEPAGANGKPAWRGQPSVRGVTLSGGERIAADTVIFSGSVWNLYERLLPREVVSRRTLRRLAKLRLSPPSSVVYGAVKRSCLPPDALPIEVFADSPDRIDERDITCYFASLEDPSLCPPGLTEEATVFLLIGPAAGSWPHPDDGYKNPRYEAQKEAERNRMIDAVNSHFPRFREGIVFSEAGTPTSIERYLMKKNGAVAGPLQSMGQAMMQRQHARTPVGGLFMCGESTVMGTGSPAVTVSGISAADLVLRELGAPEYRAHPHWRQFVRIIPRGDAGNLMGREELRPALDCQWCEDAPCRRACPASIDIPNVMRKVYCSNFAGAAKLARGAATQAACHTCVDSPCQKACVLNRDRGTPIPTRALITALTETESC